MVTLLLLPLCVAAFYTGWSANDARSRRLQERYQDAAKQRWAELQVQLEKEQSIRSLFRQNSIERSEHVERMKQFEQMKRDPASRFLDRDGRF